MKPYLRKKLVSKKKNLTFPNMVRLQEQILRRDNKTYFFGVELPGFYDKNEQMEEKPEPIKEKVDEKSDDEDGKFQRFFLTEEPNLREPASEKKKDVQIQREKDEGESFNAAGTTENKQSKFEEQKSLLNQNYEDFKKTAFEIVGESKEYENAINLNSAYKILKNLMKKPNSIDFEDFTEPHYMKPTSVIQKFKFNGLFLIFS